MLTYVINLERSVDRRQVLTEKLARDSWPHTFVNAVDGRELSAQDRALYSPLQAFLRFGRGLKAGELACYLSHLKCLRQFLATDEPVCLVLEDDVDWTPGTGAVVQELAQVLGQHREPWEVVNLGHVSKRPALAAPIARIAEDNAVSRIFDFPLTTHALLWNREGARHFLHRSRRIFDPVDVAARRMYSGSGLGLGLVARLVFQANFDSEIDASGSAGSGTASKPVEAWRRLRARQLRKYHLIRARRGFAAWTEREDFAATADPAH